MAHPRALLFTVLQRLPGTLFIPGRRPAAQRLLRSAEPEAHFQITLNLALGYLVFSVYLSVMRPGGIGETHFRMPRTSCRPSATACATSGCPAAPHHAVDQGGGEPSSLGNDVIGQGMTMLLLGLTAYLVLPISRARIKGEASMLQTLTAVALALAPVALMVLAALGYYYTA